MITGQDLLNRAEVMRAKPYIFGYEVKLNDSTPKAADCSELVQWVCYQEGVKPEMPDGATNQFHHCENEGLLISIEDAKTTVGALLFRIGKTCHVAFSVGDGYHTFEARGKNYKIGNQPITIGRAWTHAALIPGVEYEGWEIEDD